ncbi:MAG: hypothetical protein ABW039_03510 [Sphingobium sp.]
MIKPRTIIVSLLSGCLAFAPAVANAQKDSMASLMQALGMNGLSREELEKAIRNADAHPLGSDKNPVRVSSPAGERAYLSRLICADGRHPGFERGGSTGMGPFGTILDVYAVDCANAPTVSVYMDMYHSDYVEVRAVPGFTIKP